MAPLTPTTIPVTKSYVNTSGPTGTRLDLLDVVNQFIKSYAALGLALSSDGVTIATVLSRGTTVTLALTSFTITVAGVPVVVAAQTAQAFGALGTIPASTWGIIGVDAVAAGTISFVSGAANYTTGYATEALAIAAMPAKTAAKARAGYVTILASGSGFVVGTDALAGGSGGNPATTTNYYPIASPFELVAQSANAILLGSIGFSGAKQIGNMSGTVVTTTAGGGPLGG